MIKKGFVDSQGNFHLTQGLAKDFRKKKIEAIDLETAELIEIFEEDLD